MSARTAPCTVGIVFAVAIEADPFERQAEQRLETRAAGLMIHEGTVAGARVAWCVGGVGTAAAGRAARLLLDGHRPRLLVSAGFAGGLDPGLSRGAVVRPTAVVAEDAPQRLALVGGVSEGAVPPRPMTIITVSHVAATPAAKRAIADRTAAHLVDMETHAVAAVAARAGVPCAGVRVISDAVDDALPPEVAALARPQSRLRRLGAALGAVGRRPGAAVDLWRLYEHAVVDARSLAAALADTCRAVGIA